MIIATALSAALCTSAADPNVPTEKVVRVTDFGALPDGISNNVAAIARATARCVELRGCTLVFPPRARARAHAHASDPVSEFEGTPYPTVYRTSSFRVPSNTTVWVPAGVQLRGTESDAVNLNASVWPVQPRVESPMAPCMSCPYACGGGCGPTKRAWIFVQNATNVTITGGGSLHGGGAWWWCARADNKQHRPLHCSSTMRLQNMCAPRMIHVLGSRAVKIHGLDIRWSPFWTLHVQLSRDIEIFNISVLNPHNTSYSAPNGDGIDVSSSKNVHVHDVILDVSDDATAVRAGSGWAGRLAVAGAGAAATGFGGRCATEDIVFERLTVRNGHSVGRCGEDITGGIRNVTWRDIVVNGAGPVQRGDLPPHVVRFEVNPTDGGAFERITFERISGEHVRSAFSFMMNHATYLPNTTSGGSTAYPPRVPGAPFPPLAPVAPVLRNIVVRDVHVSSMTGAASLDMPTKGSTRALGNFFTLRNAPVVNLTLHNITLLPVAARAGAGWTCAAASSQGQVFACNASVVNVTPPLLHPKGCALVC